MRVIAGAVRGRRLKAPKGMMTRPTSDRTRESLFNILAGRIDLTDCAVLDICAGSGALGIEALSRGARNCCFVERGREALECITINLKSCDFMASATVMPSDARKALDASARQGRSFDLVFFDPPYESDLYADVPHAVMPLLAPDGILVIECSSRRVLPDIIGSLVKVDSRRYGDTKLELFRQGDL